MFCSPRSVSPFSPCPLLFKRKVLFAGLSKARPLAIGLPVLLAEPWVARLAALRAVSQVA
jgi:hypothetical protein